ncbi:MAG: pyridoxal phosphate-dependent aminotransferase [Verrucomicrobiae bacterium]|nr:pyridoxal phosphate-dependent aminotransferase [Verrucomicrobiae bacterium]
MQVAKRIQEVTPSQTLAIDAKAKQLKAAGEDVLSFAAGEPDFDTPEHIKAAAMGALEAGFTKYTPSSGIPELRQAIADKLKEDNGLDYKPSQIIVNCGAKHSCFNAMMAVLNEGDEVLIPAPYWLSYPEMVRIAGGEPYIVPTTAENGYKLTPELFRENISPGTKMVILNSPGNPTGSVYTEAELVELAEIALEEEIYILSDEIYEKLIYGDAKAVSIASFSKGIYDMTLTVNGFSKAYAMTGWRLGYVAAPEHIAAAIDSLQSHSTSHPTSFAQKGALAALRGPQDCVAHMRDEFDTRRQRMVELLRGISGVKVTEPQGAFYVLPDISQFRLGSQEFAEKLLEKHKVAVVPGIAFGDDNTVRLSYAASLEQIESGLERFSRFCQSLK